MIFPAPKAWILDSRDFTFLLGARFLVGFATQIQAIAVGWLIYQIKQDPLYLGLIGLAEALPALGFALISGWIVDRSRPLLICQRAVACSALSALLLFLIASPHLPLADTEKVTAIFIASFLTGFARAFLGPALFTMLPMTVNREKIGRATAWSTSLQQVANLSGPAIGGFFYAFAGGTITFASIFLMLLFALITSRKLQVGREKKNHPAMSTGIRKNFLTGFHFVFSNQMILAALSLDMFGVLFGGATALFPVFARDIFVNGPIGLGILRACMPMGSFLMGWYLIRFPATHSSGKLLFIAFLGFGLFTIGFGLSNSFPLSCALLLALGICDSISMVMRQTILQLSTPTEMRGRVAAVSSIFIGSSNEIGAFESGLTAKLLGTRSSVVFGGLMTLVVLIITWFKAPKLRNLDLLKL